MSKKMAVIENGIVINTILCNEDEKETNNLVTYTDDNPAYIGGDYVDGFFYAPKPFASWVRNNGEWQAPIPKPDSGFWRWDENSLTWIEEEYLW